jgi:hypothetical protein
MEIISFPLYEKLSKVALSMLEAHEQICHDTPAFYVGKNYLYG